ncbi:tetratricopeptide repeat-containing sensor histidine kinase [Tenacibaculum agarivorans]|uniref:tetratricopeptide repeat-containing sensor histidine kinase n=1 Tax=Tenacibaculum agarivorans TaxID=1908389 RepID=UPI00094BAA83|nr:ATP-binding protein [Tenacibaculum agarivorans]
MKVKSLSSLLFLTLSLIAQNQDLKILENKELIEAEKAYDLFYKQNKIKEAYKFSHKLLETLKTDASKSYLTCLISSYFVSNKMSDSILFYANKTLGYEKFSSDSVKRKRCLMGYVNLGNGYLTKGLLDNAKEAYLEGMLNAREWGFEKDYYFFTANLSNVYIMEEEYEKAISFCEESIKSQNELTQKNAILTLGNIYGELKEFRKSNEYYQKGLKLNKDPFTNLAIRLNIVVNDLGLGIEDKVILRLKRIIEESRSKEYKQVEIEAIKQLAYHYIEKKKYKLAEELEVNLIKENLKKGNLDDVLMSYSLLKRIKKEKGDYKSSLLFYEKYIKLKDSIKALQKTKEINELEIKFETAQKEKEIALLKKNEELKDQKIAQQATVRNIILIGSILIIITILFLLRFYFQKLKTQKKLNKTQEAFNYQKIKSLMKKQELELVKASIEGQDTERKRLARGLHDSIGSNMAAIQLQFAELPEGSIRLQKIKNDLSETYEQIRELSHNLLPKKIRQNDYSVVLNQYIKNIDEIADVKLNLSVTEKDIINQADKHLQSEIFAILQELISNTLKHAKASVIDIQLEVIEDVIYLSYEDDGIGFDTKKIHNGIGLKNMKDRVGQLSGNCIIDSYPQRGTLFRMEVDKDIYIMREVV